MRETHIDFRFRFVEKRFLSKFKILKKRHDGKVETSFLHSWMRLGFWKGWEREIKTSEPKFWHSQDSGTETHHVKNSSEQDNVLSLPYDMGKGAPLVTTQLSCPDVEPHVWKGSTWVNMIAES